MNKTFSLKKIGVWNLSFINNLIIDKKITFVLAGLLISLVVTYGYFVKQTIQNIVLRESVEERISDLGSEVSNLEVTYIRLKNQISLEFAHSLGYIDIPEVKFVSKSLLGKALTVKDR